MLGSMMFEGGEIIRERIKRYQIDCDYRPGGLFVAMNDKQLATLEEQKENWERYGNKQLELLDANAIRREVASDRYTGALLDHSGGHIHPLNLAIGEADAIRLNGGRVYELSAVTQIQHTTPAVVRTAKGQVTAKYVIVAGNAYLGDKVEPELAKRSMPCGTQVITTERLSEDLARSLIPKNYCVEDCNYLLDYYRLTADNRLLYGGGVVYGARDPDDVERLVVPKLLKTFPQLKGVKIDYRWTGNFLLTLSRMPQFGRLDTNIYYMQGLQRPRRDLYSSSRTFDCRTAARRRRTFRCLRQSAALPVPRRAHAACRLPRWARRITACAIVWAFNFRLTVKSQKV